MRVSLFRSTVAGLAFAVAAGANAQGGLSLQTVVTGLTAPLGYVPDPTRANTGYVIQKGGAIRTVSAGALGANLLQIPSGAIATDGERGLLGLTLAPDWATSGKAYAYFTRNDGNNQIAEFTRGSNGALDYSTRRDIISFTKTRSNHNGGTIAFGPDGFLYAGTGDSGGAYDPDGAAQNLGSTLGKMLRIDPRGDDYASDPTRNYAVPSGNPFIGRAGADPAIWHLGLRNPNKWSFDPLNGAMLIADVGQDTREEMDYVPNGAGGRNFGWLPFEGSFATGMGTLASGTAVFGPTFELQHTSQVNSLSGGAIVRGGALGPQNDGRYFFGDFVSGTFSSIRITVGSNGEASAADLIGYTNLGSFGNVASVDRDTDGTLLISDYNGRLLRVVPEPASIAALGIGALALLRRRRRA